MKHCNVNRWKNRSRRGFTLMELLIVVGIIAILAGTTIVSVTTLIPSLRQKELDNSAREIFLAAQNRLTMMQATGELDEMERAGYAQCSVDNIECSYLASYNEANYLKTTLSSGEFSGEYIVEFNLETAQVISVFCSDGALSAFQVSGKGIGYESVSFLRTITGWRSENSSVRKTYARKNGQDQIGYYDYLMNGGSLASENQDNNGFSVKVVPVNQEELYLYVSITPPTDITVNGAPKVTVSLNGVEIPAATLTKRGYKEKDADNKILLENRILLDSCLADFTFAKLSLSGVTAGDEIVATVTVQVTGTTTDNKSKTYTTMATSTAFNSLYADSSTDTTADIAYVRHLENLNNRDGNTGGYQEAKQVADINYATAISRWSNKSGVAVFNTTGHAIPAYKPVRLWRFDYDGQNNKLINFTISGNGCVGIFSYLQGDGHWGTSRYTEWIKNVQLVNMKVTNTSKSVNSYTGALAGKTTSYAIENCNVYIDSDYFIPENPNYDGYEDFTVSGGQCVGGLIGMMENSGTTNRDRTRVGMSKCFAAEWTVTADVESGKAGYAGGLVGKAYNNNDIRNCYANTYKVTGTYAGGFVGYYGDDDTNKSYLFNDCYAVTEVLQGVSASAGFIAKEGTGNVTYKHCYALIGSEDTAKPVAGDRYGFSKSGGSATCYFYADPIFEAGTKQQTGEGTQENQDKDLHSLTLAEIADLLNTENGKWKGNTAWTASTHDNSNPYVPVSLAEETTENTYSKRHEYLTDANAVFAGVSLTGLPNYGNWPKGGSGSGSGSDGGLVDVKINDGWDAKYASYMENRIYLKDKGNTEAPYICLISKDSSKGEYYAVTKEVNAETNEVTYTDVSLTDNCWVYYKEGDTYIQMLDEAGNELTVLKEGNTKAAELKLYTISSEVKKDGETWCTSDATAPTLSCTYTYSTSKNGGKLITLNPVDLFTQNMGFEDHAYIVPMNALASYVYSDVNTAVTKGKTTNKHTDEKIEKYQLLTAAYFSVTYQDTEKSAKVPAAELYPADSTGISVSKVDGNQILPTAADAGFKYWDNGDGKKYLPDGYYWGTGITGKYDVTDHKVVFNACWESKSESNRTITYDKNTLDSMEWPYNEPITITGAVVMLPEYKKVNGEFPFKRAGYNFIGWNTQPDGTGTYYAPGGRLYAGTQSVTLYAQWAYEDTMTIIYMPNGASGGYTKPTVFSKTETTVQLSFNGYTHGSKAFGGWVYQANDDPTSSPTWKVSGSEPYNVSTSMLIELVKDYDMNWLVTLYANWSDSYAYNVSYRLEKMSVLNSMGGAYRNSDYKVYFGCKPGYVVPTDKKDVHVYVDKNRDGRFSEAERLGTDCYVWEADNMFLNVLGPNVKGDLLIAISAVPGKHTITYRTPNSTITVKEYNAYGTYVTLKSANDCGFSYDKKIFSGWKDEDGEVYPAGYAFMVEHNMVLTAQWDDGNSDDVVGVFTYNYYRYNKAETVNGKLFGMFEYDKDISTQYNNFVPNGEIQYVDSGKTMETLNNGGQPYFVGTSGEQKMYYYGLILPKDTKLFDDKDNPVYTITMTLTDGSTVNVDINKANVSEESLDNYANHKSNIYKPATLFKGKLVPNSAEEHLLLKPGAEKSVSLVRKVSGLHVYYEEDSNLPCTTYGSSFNDFTIALKDAFGFYVDPDPDCEHMRRVAAETTAFPDYDYYFFSNLNSGNELLSEVVSITVTRNKGTESEKSNVFDFNNYARPYQVTEDQPGFTSDSTLTQTKLGITGQAPMISVSNGNLPTLSRSYANFFLDSSSQQGFSVEANLNGYTVKSVILRNELGNMIVTSNRLFTIGGSSDAPVYTFNANAMAELKAGTYEIEFTFATGNGGEPLEDPISVTLNVYNGVGYRYMLVAIKALENNNAMGEGSYGTERYVQLSEITLAADEDQTSVYHFEDAARIYDLQDPNQKLPGEKYSITIFPLGFNWNSVEGGISYQAAAPGEDAYSLIDNNVSTKFCERFYANGRTDYKIWNILSLDWDKITTTLKTATELFQSTINGNPPLRGSATEEGTKMYNYLLIDVGEGYQVSQGFYPYISYTTAPDTSVFQTSTDYWGDPDQSLRSPTEFAFYGSNNQEVTENWNTARNASDSSVWTNLTGNLNVKKESNKATLMSLIKQNKKFIGPFKDSNTLKYKLTYYHYESVSSTNMTKWTAESQKDVFGDQVVTYAIPTRGVTYNFFGWTTDSTKVEDPSAVEYLPGDHIYLIKNITLYPVFSNDKTPSWSLIYNADAGNDTVTNMPLTVNGYSSKDSEKIAISTLVPQRDGWEFAGWKRKLAIPKKAGQTESYVLDSTVYGYGSGQTQSILLNQNITLYAQWTEKTGNKAKKSVYVEDYDGAEVTKSYTSYAAKFNGGNVTPNAVTDTRITYEMSVTDTKTFVYTFSLDSTKKYIVNCFVDNVDVTDSVQKVTDEDQKLDTYTVTIELKASEAASSKTLKIKIREKDKVTIIYYPNHDEGSPTYLLDDEKLFTKDEEPTTWGIAEDSALTLSESTGYSQPVIVTNDAGEPTGETRYMHLIGWNTEPGGNGLTEAEAKRAYQDGDLVLYAQWRWIVTYNLGDGVIAPENQEKENVGKTLFKVNEHQYTTYAKNGAEPQSIPTFVDNTTEGIKVLNGWSPDMQMIKGDTTFTAKYKPAVEVSFKLSCSSDEVKYFITKSDNLIDTKTLVDGTRFGALPEPKSKDGNSYKFKNWYYLNDKEKVPITSETTYDFKVMGTTFYAEWDRYYKVTFEYKGITAFRFLKDGQEYNLPTGLTIAENTGFTFLGWYKDSPKTPLDAPTQQYASNITTKKVFHPNELGTEEYYNKHYDAQNGTGEGYKLYGVWVNANAWVRRTDLTSKPSGQFLIADTNTSGGLGIFGMTDITTTDGLLTSGVSSVTYVESESNKNTTIYYMTNDQLVNGIKAHGDFTAIWKFDGNRIINVGESMPINSSFLETTRAVSKSGGDKYEFERVTNDGIYHLWTNVQAFKYHYCYVYRKGESDWHIYDTTSKLTTEAYGVSIYMQSNIYTTVPVNK